jgi:hypothetical protein
MVSANIHDSTGDSANKGLLKVEHECNSDVAFMGQGLKKVDSSNATKRIAKTHHN